MTIIGIPITRATSMRSFSRSILKLCWLMTVASSSDVVILLTSAGWNLTGPNSNHDRDPFTSSPRKITATSSPSTIRYIGREVDSQNWAGITNRIRAARPRAVSIQTNCLPER